MKYNDIEKEIEFTKRQIATYEKEEKVKIYLTLQGKLKELKALEERTYKKEMFQKYKNCNHITVLTKRLRNETEGTSRICRACVKCGLNTAILYTNKSHMTPEEEITYDYLSENFFAQDIPFIPIECNLAEATTLYNDIKKCDPKRTDEEIIEIMETYLKSKEKIKELKK